MHPAASAHRPLTRTRLLRASLLAGLGLLIIKLLATGQLARYLSPMLDPLTLLVGLAVLLMAGVEAWRALVDPPCQQDDDHGHAHATAGPAQWGGLLLLGGTLALGTVLVPRALSTAALAGDDPTAYVAGPRALAAPEAAISPAQAAPAIEDFTDFMRFLRDHGQAGAGQPVRLIGLVTLTTNLRPGEFTLMRYAVVHCVADAQAYGVVVYRPQATVQENQWVQVDGIVATRPREGFRLVAIEAATVTPVPEPEQPYMRPPH
jgi:uncharacterized repeat protein (TIGR03943 family)